MPSTLTGLILFVTALTPGFTYLVMAERRGLPRRNHSAFRETAQVVLASVFALAMSLGLFGLARLFCGALGPDVSELIRDPSRYWERHYGEVLLWGGGLLLFACGLS